MIGSGGTHVKIEVLADADAVARKAAASITAEARDAVVERGRFIMAVSRGHTPPQMLRALAGEKSRGRKCTWSRWTSAWPLQVELCDLKT